MDSIYFAEVENIKGILFNNRQALLKSFLTSLNTDQQQKFKAFNEFKKLNDQKNKNFKILKNSFFISLTKEQIKEYEILDRSKKAYKSLLKIETTLAVNSLLKNEI
jgi:hypothetical protein